MNVAMFTNLYLPLVGGIQRSIATFKREFEKRSHHVLVVTPALDNGSVNDPDVIEVPAIQNFNGSDFSVAIPIPGYLSKTLDDFAPDLVHSHHPFFLGDAALRAATKRDRPLVFTYHTMWEHYLHYAPSDSPAMQEFVKRMAIEYCNLCDQVITPCASIADILRDRGVTVPMTAIPTGIDTARFCAGDGTELRQQHDIPADAPVAGYIGRLGPEKNLEFVAAVLTEFCRREPTAHALIVGRGESATRVKDIFSDAGCADRLHMPGVLEGEPLINAYHALDVFVFGSKSETQGLVLAEAMAAGCPVVALDAPGARDIVRDGENGRLLDEEDASAFAAAVGEALTAPEGERRAMQESARQTGDAYSSGHCAERMLELYEQVPRRSRRERTAPGAWRHSLRQLETEWNLWTGRAVAAGRALTSEP